MAFVFNALCCSYKISFSPEFECSYLNVLKKDSFKMHFVWTASKLTPHDRFEASLLGPF